MLMRVEEHDLRRLRLVARDWRVSNWSRLARRDLIVCIEAAVRRDIEQDERRAMHAAYRRRLLEAAA